MNHELPDVQAGFGKGRGTRDKLPASVGSLKKWENSRKTSTSALLTMSKPLTVCITINCGKFWKTWEYQTIWPVSWETCIQIRKQQLELDMEQQTVSNRERIWQGCILSPCLFNLYAKYTWKILDYMKHKLESRLPGEISITSDMQMTPPLWQKVKRN